MGPPLRPERLGAGPLRRSRLTVARNHCALV